MEKITIEINDKTLEYAKQLLSKYDVDLQDFIQRLVREFLIHDLDEVVSFVEKHNYGEIRDLDKLVNGFLDLLELGILTHSNLEDYVLSILGSSNYWLQDYGIDLDDFNIWLLFIGSGMIDEFIIDADRDGVSLTAIHSIEDLVEKDQSILERIEKVIEYLETDLDISVEENSIKITARARSIGELPKIEHLEKTIREIFKRINVQR